MTMEHERHTDVMHVDFCATPANAKIRVAEVGEQVGFPGQIQVRVDAETGTVYGVTIQNFASFKRKIMWEYKMASVQRAIELFMRALCAGLGINEHRNHRAPLHA